MFKGMGACSPKIRMGQNIREFFMARTFPAIVLIVVMLIIVAVIESTFTVWLLNK